MTETSTTFAPGTLWRHTLGGDQLFEVTHLSEYGEHTHVHFARVKGQPVNMWPPASFAMNAADAENCMRPAGCAAD